MMLSLMIPLEGMPWFEMLPEKHRGTTMQFAVHDRRRSHFEKRTFVWRSQYARGNAGYYHDPEGGTTLVGVIFDVFEEVE